MEQSTFASRLLDNIHTFDHNKSFKILHLKNKGSKLNILENFEILKLIKNLKIYCLKNQTILKYRPLLRILVGRHHPLIPETNA